jgi:[protein-PII] uridylyltransferase
VLGAEIAVAVGQRFGFSDWETETMSWLVRHHLLMALTAFKRDLEDPQTIADFVARVQSPERLRLLLVLTVADIRAVGPGRWNAWKATLLRDLYWRASERMTGEMAAGPRAGRVEAAQRKLRARLAGWSEAEIEAHLARGYASYWLSFDAETHVRHALLVRRAEAAGDALMVETRVVADSDFTEVVIYAPDQAGLFAKIAGAMALAGANIVDAKIATLANGMALDTFTVQDESGAAFSSRDRLGRLESLIRRTLAGETHPAREIRHRLSRALPSRTGVFTVSPRILIDNKASNDSTVIEVNGRDRLGFLFDVTSALTELGLHVASAHVSTWGERVVDVFYVRDIFGLKIDAPTRIELIRARLLAAVEPPGLASAPGAVPPASGAPARVDGSRGAAGAEPVRSIRARAEGGAGGHAWRQG